MESAAKLLEFIATHGLLPVIVLVIAVSVAFCIVFVLVNRGAQEGSVVFLFWGLAKYTKRPVLGAVLPAHHQSNIPADAAPRDAPEGTATAQHLE